MNAHMNCEEMEHRAPCAAFMLCEPAQGTEN